MISELVREKILNLTNEEVPHSVTCVLTNYNEKPIQYISTLISLFQETR